MDLLLWRHAEAEDGDDDMKRRLTERGLKQAQTMAAWIRAQRAVSSSNVMVTFRSRRIMTLVSCYTRLVSTNRA